MDHADMPLPRAPERLSLMDLKPKRVVVSLSGDREIEVGPLSGEDVVRLMQKHVALQKYMMRVPISFTEIAETVPGAVASIIAVGCGYRGDKNAELIAASLSIEEQSEIIEGIGRATFTRGFGPFVRRIGALGAEVDFGGTGDGRVPATPSRRPSRASSTPASPKPGPGDSAPDNSPPTPSFTSETIASAA